MYPLKVHQKKVVRFLNFFNRLNDLHGGREEATMNRLIIIIVKCASQGGIMAQR